MARSSEVLPAPLGPTTSSDSPGATCTADNLDAHSLQSIPVSAGLAARCALKQLQGFLQSVYSGHRI